MPQSISFAFLRASAAAVLCVLLFLLPAPALAGDSSEITPVGFSEDGRYFAYLRYGVYDGSGLAFGELFFLDVPENRFVAPKVIRIEGEFDIDGFPEDLEGVRAQALEKGKSDLRLYGIVRENYGTGQEIYPETPPGDRGWSIEFHSNFHKTAFMVMSVDQIYEAPGCNTEFGPTKIFTLTVHDEFEAEQTPGKVLQEDRKLYKSRGCVIGYGFHSLLIHGDNIVIFVNATTPGFEGPNVRQLVVGGTLVFP